MGITDAIRKGGARGGERLAPRPLERLSVRPRGRLPALIRRVVAAVLFLAAAVFAIHPAAASGETRLATVVAARDLDAGHVLARDDLTVVQYPDTLRPEGSLHAVGNADGRLLAGAARAGEPITGARLVNTELTGTGDSTPDPANPSVSTVPIRLSDSGIAALLQPGIRVDVVTLGEGEQGRRVLASMATVATVHAADDESRPVPGDRAQGPLVLLSVPTEVATQLAATSLGQPVTVTLR